MSVRRFALRRQLLLALGAATLARAVPTPLATFSSACTLSPAMTEGPYFIDERLDRSDITAGATHAGVAQGLPLTLVIEVVSAHGTGCLPLKGVQVDVWHADATGVYSEFGAGAGQNFLRGFQVSDARGKVAFQTVYPGWYQGRTVHMHVKARLFDAAGNRTFEFTSQLFFDDAVNDVVMARAPYNTRGTRGTRNANDGIYGGRTATLVDIASKDGSQGYVATAVLSLDLDPAVAALNYNQAGLGGHWYDTSTGGQGFGLEIYPGFAGPGTGQAFGGWFTYDTGTAGDVTKQRWYTFNGPAGNGSLMIPVQIYRNIGGSFDAGPITNGVNVGSGALSFSSCSTGQFAYAFTDGSARTGVIPIERLAPNVTCTATGDGPTNPDFALSGNWFDPSTSGQGLVVEVNPNVPVIFMSWYTYAANGAGLGVEGQRWLTGQAGFTPGARTFTMSLYQTTGGVFDQASSPPPYTQAIVAGTATLTFQSCTRATLSYAFTAGANAGRSRTISLQRLGPTPPGCIG